MTQRVSTSTRGDSQNKKGRTAAAGLLLLVATLAQAQVVPAPAAAPAASPAAPPAAPTTSDPAFQAADAGYRAYAEGRFDEAAGHAERALALRPGEPRWQQLRVDSLAAAAYLALREQDDAAALQFFDRAGAAGPVSATVALDAGYTARRLNERRRAIAWFRQGLAAPGSEALDERRRFAIRRDIATLEQWWGGSAIVTNGPVGIAAGGLPTGSGRRQVTQAGGELFVRPYDLQPRAGGTVEGFVRYFQTLRDDGPGAITGGDTGQGSIGLRWRPWDETNVVFELARLVKIGDASRDDTQVRVAWSKDVGMEAPPAGTAPAGATHWPAWRVYAEANRFLDTHLTVAAAEAQWGRAFRFDTDSRSTLFPHVLLATSYDNSYARANATSAGVGVTHRIPLGEAWGLAYAGWTLQYRVRLAGDEDRARGFFFQVFTSF